MLCDINFVMLNSAYPISQYDTGSEVSAVTLSYCTNETHTLLRTKLDLKQFAGISYR